MPKIPAKYEDWTPPWGDGEIDPDQVARLVYNLQLSEQTQAAELKVVKKDNDELTSANEVFKAASEEAVKEHSTEVQKAVAAAEKERDQAIEKLKDVERESDLKEVRIQFPALEKDDLERLHGDDLDALLEDAEKFVARIAPPAATEEEQQDEEPNPVRRAPRIPRTPGDPNAGSGADTSVADYLAKRAQETAWIG